MPHNQNKHSKYMISILFILMFFFDYLCSFFVYYSEFLTTVIWILIFNICLFKVSISCLNHNKYLFRIGAYIINIIKIITLIISSILTGFYLTHQRIFTDSDLIATSNSNLLESVEIIKDELLNSGVNYLIFITISIGLFFTFFYYIWQRSKHNSHINIKFCIRDLSLTYCILFLGFLFSSWLPLRYPRDLILKFNKNQTYLKRLETNKITRNQNAKIENASKKEKGETCVLIIGESACRNYMECYGYNRPTTPNFTQMIKDDKLIIINAYSINVLTTLTVPYMLSTANYYNNKKLETAATLIGLCNHAGINTYFISNQTPKCAEFIPIIASDSNFHKYLSELHCELANIKVKADQLLLDEVKRQLTNIDFTQNNLIILQMFGSHYPYHMRLPNTFHSKLKEENYINSKEYNYCKTIEYSDQIITDLITLFNTKCTCPLSIIYTSDHGENPTKRMRTTEPSLFIPDWVEIPMAIYLSKAYKLKYPEIETKIKKNQHKMVPIDLIPELISDIFQLHWNNKSDKLSLLSDQYIIKDGVISLLNKQITIQNGKYLMINSKDN